MAPLTPFFTQAQLENAVGGARQLVQLGDRNGDGVVDADFLADVNSAANGEVYSLVGVDLNVLDPNLPTAGVLQGYAIDIAAFWAWKKSSGGQAMPEIIAKAHEDAVAALKEFRSGERRLDLSGEVGKQFPAQQVSMDATGPSGLAGSGWTRKNWGDFC